MAEDSTSAPLNSNSQVLNRLITTTTWILGAFGGLAALLLAGFQFSSLSATSPTSDLIFSLAGAVISIIFLAYILFDFSKVHSAKPAKYEEVLELNPKDPLYFTPFKNFAEMDEAYRNNAKKYYENNFEGTTLEEKNKDRQRTIDIISDSRAKLHNYLNKATVENALIEFDKAMRRLKFNIGFIALGIALFSYGLSANHEAVQKTKDERTLADEKRKEAREDTVAAQKYAREDAKASLVTPAVAVDLVLRPDITKDNVPPAVKEGWTKIQSCFTKIGSSIKAYLSTQEVNPETRIMTATVVPLFPNEKCEVAVYKLNSQVAYFYVPEVPATPKTDFFRGQNRIEVVPEGPEAEKLAAIRLPAKCPTRAGTGFFQGTHA